MDYDPVKDKLGAIFGRRPWLQRVFFATLGAVFLRNWYVRRALREVMGEVQASRQGDVHSSPQGDVHSSPQGEVGGRVRVLDAGTGFGQYAYWIAKHFPSTDVVAVDIKEDYLERARAFVASQGLADRITFAVDDLTDLKHEGPFDVVLSVDVMEHIEDDRAVFANFRRVLADGGVVIVNTPSDQGGSGVTPAGTPATDNRHAPAAGPTGFIGEHVRDGYPLAELNEKLSTAGLEVFDARYTYGKWGSLAWRILVKYPISMLNRSFAFVVLLPFYYLIAFPLGMLLNAVDVARDNARGTGLIVRASRAVAR